MATTKKTTDSRALAFLRKTKTVDERAEKYVSRIQKSLQLSEIDALEEKIEKKRDRVFDLENFNLETNLNKAMRQMTKEECEAKFKEIMDLEYEIKMDEMELEMKKEIFNNLFS